MKLIKENCPTCSKVHAVIMLEEAGLQSQQSGQRVRIESQKQCDCAGKLGPINLKGAGGR